MLTINSVLKDAARLNKTIVFPEGEISDRTLQAVKIIQSKKIAKCILLGDATTIFNKGYKLSGVTIINPNTSDLREELAAKLYEKRKSKGVSLEEANKLITNPFYFAALMVECGFADGTIGGAETSSADALRPALQVIKAREGISTISASTMFVGTKKLNIGENNVILVSDTALNIDPTPQQLCDIAYATADTARQLAKIQPKVAMLSFSSVGSGGEHILIKKVKDALVLINKKNIGENKILVDGEFQVDTAIVPSVAKLKAPKSEVAGRANVLIMPDLNAGNIGYKLIERFGGLTAVGQIMQGFNKPVNDLSRGCNVEDIVIMTAVTVLQSANN